MAGQRITWSSGQRYLNMNTGYCSGGWNAYYFSSGAWWKGIATAKHCGGLARLDLYSPLINSPSDISAIVRSLASGSLQDIQFMSFDGQRYNNLGTRFNDGANKGGAVLRGAMYPSTGSWVCKVGRATGRTCGYVMYSTFRNSEGTFYKASTFSSSASKPLSKSSDSGGVVFSGNLMVGVVYGGDSSGSLYFSPSFMWKSYLPNLRIYCSC